MTKKKKISLTQSQKQHGDTTQINEINLNAALALHRQGQLAQAEIIYKEILKLEPQHFDTLQLLATIALQKHNYLAAVGLFDNALEFNSNHAETLYSKGNALFMLKRYEEALELYNQTLQIKPDYAEVLNNRGVILRNLKRFEEALESYDCAIKIKSDYADASNNRGNVLRDLKRNEEALDSYKRSLEIRPDFADAWNNLGNLFNDNSDDELALNAYQNAAKMDPKNWQYQFSLAQSLHLLGDIEGSRTAFAKALAIKEHAGIRIRYETLLPVVMMSEKAVSNTRNSLESSFKQLLERKLEINDPMSDITVTPLFHLAYHGECNVDLMRGYTDLVRAICPSVDYVSPHCLIPHIQRDKIRIGFTSKFFYEHTIGKFFRGILKNINRSQFEIFVFVTTTKQDEVTRWTMNHADHFEVLPPTLAEARQHISNHGLDILVYTDIGMDPFTYYLAFSRLAPVQCVLYGHPDTTGIPTIDYYLSGGACESEKADTHYTEKLIRLDPNSTYTYYYRPNNRATQKTRSDLNLPESLHLYTCAQSLFKIHPEMDAVFDEILARDLDGCLVLFDDVKQRRIELFKTRLQNRMRHYDRVIFLPRLTLPDFLQVLYLSDALLDSFHFCGGNTSFDSFAAESPIVTLPGEFMRGRQTLGLYKRMNFTDLVASDKADYIDKALRLGTDVEFRKIMCDKLAARVSVIFEDSGVVHALEQFFISSSS